MPIGEWTLCQFGWYNFESMENILSDNNSFLSKETIKIQKVSCQMKDSIGLCAYNLVQKQLI